SKAVHREEIDDNNDGDDDRDDDDKVIPRTTYYVYDNEDIILEYQLRTPNSKLKTIRYVHGQGIDEPLAIEQKGKVYCYHFDGLGSVTALTDGKGKIAVRYEYDSFGKIKRHGHKVKQPYTYTAREYDRETGLYYYRARYYDPMVGRFINKDPIGFRGGINLYSYVGNNPVLFIDPYGLFSTFEAIYHYFLGGGSAVTVNFAEVDIGLQPKDFPGYQTLIYSMYKKDGTLTVDKKTSKDIGGWAGHVTYRLKGVIKSNTCEWKFNGYIGAFNDPFNFDALPWGERAYWAELVTRLIGSLPIGQAYNIGFSGHRKVTDGGKW
ncbi:MAG: lipid II-degrading bacteriocin, partial [Nitrospinota bacterium]